MLSGLVQTSMARNALTPSPVEMYNLLVIALSQMSIKQDEIGQWYVDSGAAAQVTDNVGKFISLIPYKGHGSIVMDYTIVFHIVEMFLFLFKNFFV